METSLLVFICVSSSSISRLVENVHVTAIFIFLTQHSVNMKRRLTGRLTSLLVCFKKRDITFIFTFSDFLDEEQLDETSFDLFEISHITRKTLGAKQFRGQNLDAPAYRFIRFDFLPPVDPPILKQILEQIQNNEGFVFVASMRQDHTSRGTLVALEGPGGRRQFEIISNGPANTLDLVYWVDGSQNVVSFEDVDLSDSQWKNITLHIHGENANLFVGCNLLDSFVLDEPFYEHLRAEGSRMYVAKGSNRENHFRVRWRWRL